MEEGKVTYRDGDAIRALRGRVEILDDFIRVKRKNKDILINKKDVIKIEGEQLKIKGEI